MSLLSKIFGGGSGSADVKELLQQGAKVIDVRTPSEFQGGHVAGSKNIPLQEFQARMNEVKKIKEPIVLCCASGMRSGQALRLLKQHREDCVNGGGWTSVNALV